MQICGSVLPGIQQIVRELDPNLAIAGSYTMEEVMAEAVARTLAGGGDGHLFRSTPRYTGPGPESQRCGSARSLESGVRREARDARPYFRYAT